MNFILLFNEPNLFAQSFFTKKIERFVVYFDQNAIASIHMVENNEKCLKIFKKSFFSPYWPIQDGWMNMPQKIERDQKIHTDKHYPLNLTENM